MPGGHALLDRGFACKAATAITKWRFVKLNASGTVEPCDTLGEAALGVAQESVTAAQATAGRHINIRIAGITQLEVAADLAITDNVRTDANGRAAALASSTSSQNSPAQLLGEPSASGDVVLAALAFGRQIDT